MTGRIEDAVARRLGVISRGEAGLIAPVSVSHNVDPAAGGVAFHHGGDNVPIGSHAECLSTWRGWQRYHMGDNYDPPASGHGWVDIAYTIGVCQHGYSLAGRGFGVRTAANGTTDGNNRFLAVVWIGGRKQEPTQEALNAILAVVLHLRTLGAGDRTVGHSDLSLTSCPHPTLLKLARAVDRTPIRQEEDDMPYFTEWPESEKKAMAAFLREELLGGVPSEDNRWRDPSDGELRNLATFIKRSRVNEAMLKTVLKELDQLADNVGIDVSELAVELGEQMDIDVSDLDLPMMTPGEVADEIARRMTD